MFFSIKGVWWVCKRIPRFFIALSSFISVFLLVFLLVGCYNVNQRSTYLAGYQFNTNSSIYSVISNQFDANSTTEGLQDVKILSGYMGVCIEEVPSSYLGNSSSSSVCFGRKVVSDTEIYEDLTIRMFNIKSSNSTDTTNYSDLNILQLAQQTSENLVHPYLLMVTIIFTILLFTITLYAMIPKLPYKQYAQYILMGLSPMTALLWAIGAIWAHVAIHCNELLIPSASMNIVEISVGSKAEALSWSAFSFLLLNCLIIWAIYFRDRKRLNDKLDDLKTSGNSFKSRYPSDGSTVGSV